MYVLSRSGTCVLVWCMFADKILSKFGEGGQAQRVSTAAGSAGGAFEHTAGWSWNSFGMQLGLDVL